MRSKLEATDHIPEGPGLRAEGPATGRWTVYPAIDLRRGRVVRLRQGDPGQETRYADDPLSVARRWKEAGAEWVHVVNLDGALDERDREHRDKNWTALGQILTTGLQVQFGGGIRNSTTLRQVLDLGVSRAVIGTAAVEKPELIEAALQVFGPEGVAVAIDTRRGRVRTRGWSLSTTVSALDLARRSAAQGVRWLIFTDVSRDGMGSGLNLETAVHLAQATGLHVVASGGVTGLEDIRRAYQAGLSGVIIGRALYEGQVDLQEALRVGEPPTPSPSPRQAGKPLLRGGER